MQEFLLAQIAQVVFNSGMRAPEKPLKVKDFMPSQQQRVSTAPGSKRRLTNRMRAEIADSFRRLFGVSGAK